GTIRQWSTGRVIKTHDNSIFDDQFSPWMNYPSIKKEFFNLFVELDKLGNKISKYTEPLNGELWMDHDLDDFKTSSGKTFSSREFKLWGGFSFSQPLSKRLIFDRI